MSMTHLSVEPAILYLGTPVVLVSSINEDGSPNLAPMSSAFWLGWRCMLGFEAVSKTPNNVIRTGECVLNLPSMNQVDAINRISMVTGSSPVPAGKALRGVQAPCRQVRDRRPYARDIRDCRPAPYPGVPDPTRSRACACQSHDDGRVRLRPARTECRMHP